jgi:hypothetical protein
MEFYFIIKKAITILTFLTSFILVIASIEAILFYFLGFINIDKRLLAILISMLEYVFDLISKT